MQKQILPLALKIFLGIFLLTLGFTAQAYIMPSYHILNKTIFHDGQGLYHINLDVVFNQDPDKGHIQETWWIENENSMRVDVKGLKELANKLQFSIIYKNKKRYSNFASFNDKPYSEEFAEVLFHYRDQNSFAQWLVNNNIADSSIFKKPNFTKGQNKIFTESFVRLSRCMGRICLALGEATPTNSTKENPGLWIEQDQFVIRKVRFPSEALIEVKSNNDYSRNLIYPTQRVLSWGSNSIEIKTLSVNTRTTSPQMAKVLSKDNPLPVAILQMGDNPYQQMIEEYYLRFR